MTQKQESQPLALQAEEALSRAFASFREASDSLSRKYEGLESRIAQLSRELRDRDRALASQGQFLEAILKSLPTGVLVLTPGGQVLWSNPQVARWLSPSDREVMDLLRSWGVWPVLTPREEPMAVFWKDRSLLIEISQVADDEGRSSGHVLIVSDVTRLREMEEEVERDRRLRDMGEMVAMIAHELRNPLGSVELFSSLLGRELKGQGSQALEAIRSSVTAMDRLIGNLLFHTRLPEISRTTFVATDLLDRLYADCQRIGVMRGRAGGANVSLSLDAAGEVFLSGDEGLLYHALFNLVTNAFQACFESGGGHVVLSLRQLDHGGALFRIADDGPGIPRALRDRIFDPFFTTRAKGTGLGLPIVHKIVLAHQGLLRIDSTEQGATFTITLPGGEEAKSGQRDTVSDSRQILEESA